MSTFEKFVGRGEKIVEKEIVQKIEDEPDQYATGGSHELYSLRECPGIVIKRVKLAGDIVRRSGGDQAKAIERLKEEHAYTAAYLSGFVPKTAFMEADLGKGKEWFMLQERATGVDGWLLVYEPQHQLTEELKNNFSEFRERYRRMRNSGKVPEDQVMIDFKNQKIWVYDTNVLRSSDRMMEAEDIFALVNDRPSSGKAEDVWAFLQKHFASARHLDIRDKKNFVKSIKIPGPTYLALLDEILALNGTNLSDFEAVMQVQNICNGLAYFPPADFEENIFTLELAEKLGIPM